ncbi:MAG: F0F1 ATP synthase subunit A [Holosporales bacterium]|jgi:F-type H+-transporting ATPase subunit a|nr:F0F1 ATP synthase subunit A [Holosporales bacterium]
MYNPLHQFEIVKIVDCSIGRIDISFTQSSLFMVVVTGLICLLLHIGTREKKLIPSKKQSICEMLFRFVENIVSAQIGKEGLKYTPYMFTLFVFIFAANAIGLFPYAFTVTSHIVVTFTLAMFVFIGMNVVGITKHGMKFFRIFCHHGIPAFVKPILIPVEVLSFLIKPISLSVRLCANMIAGHVVLKMIAGAAVFFVNHRYLGIASIFPVAINAVLLGFEFLVAALQAYIFTVLSCIYFNSVIHIE